MISLNARSLLHGRQKADNLKKRFNERKVPPKHRNVQFFSKKGCFAATKQPF
ncbi:TilS substrate C-terminal domain-containing protein [Pseudidiomarina aestuarii]|uniref:TilS substrate C-terminal domain-containing protein n=1 Tax=Pseudidiomarina aestuarii TaxID=624146 RepID=UPI003A980869